MLHPELYVRQTQLAEIGPGGQRRLGATQLVLSEDLTRPAVEIALIYGERAGFLLDDGEALGSSARSFGHTCANLDLVFRHSAARDVGLGAAVALANILDVIAPSFTEEPGDSPSPAI